MSGRQRRAFDLDEALDKAVELFWRQGYEGTSIADLTAAMGINPPSLYAAFGNKRALFEKATDRYTAQRAHYLQSALAEPTAHEAAHTLLTGTVLSATDPADPAGCLTVQAALACRADDQDVAAFLARRRRATEDALHDRFVRAVADGDLSPGTDCATLARYVATVAQGLNVQASGGATRDDLFAVADTAAGAVPGPPCARCRTAGA